jgi:hypothetical protein
MNDPETKLNILLAFVNDYMQNRTTEARDDMFLYAAKLNRDEGSVVAKLNGDKEQK